MPALLTARHLEKAFPARPLFADVTVHVEVGDRIGLIGPNGAGKSTLLKVLAGLDEADAGEILVPRGTSNRLRRSDGRSPHGRFAH